MRIGFGYDVHQLVESRDLILAGLKIEHKKGLLGHSDADVLTHALMDALLGAAGLGDIGKFFPDTDPSYKDISSLELLEEVVGILSLEGYKINNIDISLAIEKPKIAPHLEKMKANLLEILKIESNSLNIKATTSEGLGFVGEEKGVSCYCVCTIF